MKTSNYFCRMYIQSKISVLNYTRRVSKMLETNLEFRKGILFIRLSGSLTKNTISDMEQQVIQKIKKSGIRNVVFNVENLTDIDLKGINSLLYTYEICNRDHGKSLLCGVLNQKIKLKLEKSRLLKYMIQTESELSAFDFIKV